MAIFRRRMEMLSIDINVDDEGAWWAFFSYLYYQDMAVIPLPLIEVERPPLASGSVDFDWPVLAKYCLRCMCVCLSGPLVRCYLYASL